MSQGPYNQVPVVRQTTPQQGHYSMHGQPVYMRREAWSRWIIFDADISYLTQML